MPDPLRRAAKALGLGALLACLVIASGSFGLRERLFGSAAPEPRRSAFSRVLGDAAPPASGRPTALRSQPWWQAIASLDGGGSASRAFDVRRDAIQWRVRAACERGRLRVAESGRSTPLVEAACPTRRVAYGTGTGARRLSVTGSGDWSLRVEQQLDVPLEEPPLPAMRAGARPVLGGALYRIDQFVEGRVTVYELARRRFALRLEGFYVTPNVDLELRLSPRPAPRTTREFRRAPSALVAPLPITAGSLNFRVPRDVDPTRYGSLVIWCPPVVSAYAAARLRPLS